jgi:hypothetical protein
MRGGSCRVAVAAQARGRENESEVRSLPGFTEGRSTVQQLLSVPTTERLHVDRRRGKPGGLVQILG